MGSFPGHPFQALEPTCAATLGPGSGSPLPWGSAQVRQRGQLRHELFSTCCSLVVVLRLSFSCYLFKGRLEKGKVERGLGVKSLLPVTWPGKMSSEHTGQEGKARCLQTSITSQSLGSTEPNPVPPKQNYSESQTAALLPCTWGLRGAFGSP